jgi:hypothetical protein
MRSLAVLRVGIGRAAVLVECIVLVGGWTYGVNALKSVAPGLSTMKPDTVAGIVTLGAALALTAKWPRISHFSGSLLHRLR